MATNEDDDQLREIFSEAVLKASPDDRERYLAGACGQNADLRRHVDSLLEAHAQAGDFLRQNVIAPGGPPLGEKPGDVIGRYKLLQQIGEGGFGVVFMAEQQEPVRRMVALKIIKAGMDTREVVARFEAERQALALMDHPNIARVLDGGTTVSGRPYFVMDLVKGLPITEFCECHRLSLEARLDLFMQVCAGVQHAHQKGVIHRDLKPTNVLVVHEPGAPGVPKVIDFGIAKAIGQKLTERTLFTRFEQLIGTPAYMSPEQAEWSGLDVDTRSDLYSLGVLLYELLTGTTPLEKETLARAALDEVRRLIREVDPPKPSTRLKQTTAIASAATQRDSKSEIGNRKSEIDPDLDWIVMKALEKDRTRRYETVNGLARDIERHLDGEPVVACPPSKAYRARKFIRKHRLAVTAVSGVALALVAGLTLALIGFAQARRERHRAESQAAIAKAVNDFLHGDLLMQASPWNSTNRNVTVREALDRASTKVADRFTNQPVVEANIRTTLAETYMMLGALDLAEQHARRAVEIIQKELAPEGRVAYGALFTLAQILNDGSKLSEAEPLIRQAADIARRTKGPESPSTLQCLYLLALNQMHSGKMDRAEASLLDVIERERRVSGLDHPHTLLPMHELARVYEASARYADALALDKEAVRLGRKSIGPKYPLTLFLNHLAREQIQLGDYVEAAEVLKELIEIDRRALGPQQLQMDLFNLQGIYAVMGKWAFSVDTCRELMQSTNNLDRWMESVRWGAVAAQLAGDTGSYRDFAGSLLSQFANTTNTDHARRVAEICLLAPDAVPDLQPVVKLVETVPSSGDSGNLVVKGIMEFRRGQFSEALRWLEGWRRFTEGTASSQAGYVCAMIQHREGDRAAARADLADAATRFAASVRSGMLGQDPAEFGRVAVVRAEAERLVQGRETSPSFDAAWLETARQQWAPVRRHLNLADQLAGQRSWAKARDEYLAAMQESVFDWEATARVDPELPQRMGISFLLAGDRRNFEQLCREWFTRLDKRPDPASAYLAVRTCLAGESDMTTDLGRLALTWSGKMQWDTPGALPWCQTMVAYRAGQYGDAIKYARGAEQGESPAIRGAPQIFRAMALAKSGRHADGRKALQEAETELGQSVARMVGDVWWDLGLCQLALDEAHQLFGETPGKK